MRFVCLHGHFYQPPRENPWLDVIEPEASAQPFADWNRRITAECYAPNAHARILDGAGRISRIVDNYSRISFNFGPTLLRWLEREAPQTYAAILRADGASRARFDGHGSAMAQPYHHVILPLCNRRDRRTQLIWGIEDFRLRFGREPEGLWLPETAVDTATLELLAECGIRFTVLAPDQARQVRAEDDDSWQEVDPATLDCRRPYRVELPSGRGLHVFFYDGSIARRIAFERLLDSGERLHRSMLEAFDGRPGAQLVHAATDGESYGHHHAHGHMALAAALARFERMRDVRLTNYARFLALAPPTHVVRVRENSSWSCAHGIERWRSDCGCASEIRAGWHQRWRAPLRETLDWLRDALAPRFESEAARFLEDPWGARDAYLPVVHSRSARAVDTFFAEQAKRRLTDAERSRTLQLLELQRFTMGMYTSCGWFFEEPSRLETVQLLRYAARAVELAEALFREPFEAELVRRLEGVPSNVAFHGHAGRIWEREVLPSRVDAARHAADHAARLLVDPQADRLESGRAGFESDTGELRHWQEGGVRLVGGALTVASRTTLERRGFEFAVMLEANGDLRGGLRRSAAAGDDGDDVGRSWLAELEALWRSGGAAELLALLERGFFTFGAETLTPTNRLEVLEGIARLSLDGVVASYHRFGGRRLSSASGPAVRAAAAVGVARELAEALGAEAFDPERIRELVERARREGLPLDEAVLRDSIGQALRRMAGRLLSAPDDAAAVGALDQAVATFESLSLPLDLTDVQNAVYRLAVEPEPVPASGPGRAARSERNPALETLARRLGLAPR